VNNASNNNATSNNVTSNDATSNDASGDKPEPRIVYCHCAFAKVVPAEVKTEVLAELTRSRKSFEAVADLCEMSARKDPALSRIAETAKEGPVVIAACFPRAVQWLFHGAGTPLPEEGVEVLNMREQTADQVVDGLLQKKAQE